MGVRILRILTLAEHPGQYPEVERPADTEHLAGKDRTLRVPVSTPHSSNRRHTEIVGDKIYDFPVPRSLILGLAKLLDDRDNPDDRQSQSPDVPDIGHPPFTVHNPDATRMDDGSDHPFPGKA